MTIKTPPATKEFREGWDRTFARVVYQEERVPCKHIVEGSIPVSGSIIIKCQDEDIILD
jgi:hypothetical protein